MFRLETFGGLALTDAAGQAVIPQRRRLALLALLAAAGERGLTREKVLAYLWSESPAENARHALEQLLYSMRRAGAGRAVPGYRPAPAEHRGRTRRRGRVRAGDRRGRPRRRGRSPIEARSSTASTSPTRRSSSAGPSRSARGCAAEHAQALRRMAARGARAGAPHGGDRPVAAARVRRPPGRAGHRRIGPRAGRGGRLGGRAAAGAGVRGAGAGGGAGRPGRPAWSRWSGA